MLLYYIILHHMILYDLLLYYDTLHDITLHYIILCYMMLLYHIVLYDIYTYTHVFTPPIRNRQNSREQREIRSTRNDVTLPSGITHKPLPLPSGKHTKKLWKDPPFLMGKSTISMAIFNSYVSHYQRVNGKLVPQHRRCAICALALIQASCVGAANHDSTVRK